MKKISIYIAGSVRKDKEDANSIFASEEIKAEITKALDGFEVIIFDPNESKILGDGNSSRFGKDCLQVTSSNFIIADLREKRGIGVGSEMVIAKDRKIPVISVCPAESHYKRTNIVFHEGTVNSDWAHPFVEMLSDAVVENFTEAGYWIKKFIKNPTKIISGAVVEESIKDYLDNYLENDADFKKKYLYSLENKSEYK